MSRFPSLPLLPSTTWLFVTIGLVLFSGCAVTPDFSALEDDELYLRRGEEFVTDAMYLAFAMEQSAEEPAEDDYYDPNRSQYSPGYMGGYGMPRYQSSFNNPYRPFGNGFGTNWGLSSYMNPFAAGGMGMGYGMGYGGWNDPFAMGYGSGFGSNYGYGSPSGYNNWNNYGYGYNNWNNGWNNGWNTNYGGWAGTGSNDSFGGFTSRTRTPIMSYTGSGSNYDTEGVLVRPKVEAPRPDEMPAVSPERSEPSTPTYVSPASNSRTNRWMQPAQSRDNNRSNSSRSWSAPEPSDNSSRSRSNSFSAPSNSGNSRSGGNSSGGSRPSGSSRSSRGGGR